MCISINGPGDPSLSLSDLETGMQPHLTWGTFLPNLGTLGQWRSQKFSMGGGG